MAIIVVAFAFVIAQEVSQFCASLWTRDPRLRNGSLLLEIFLSRFYAVVNAISHIYLLGELGI